MTATPPPPSGAGRAGVSKHKLVAAVAVVAMLLVAIPGAIEWAAGPAPHAPDGGGGPGDDGSDYRSSVSILRPETWTGVSGIQYSRVMVRDAGTLRIEGCDMTIPFEDLRLSDDPWFDVWEDTDLEIVNSTIRVQVTPQAARAVMARDRGHGGIYDPYDSENRLDDRFAFLSRTLNLRYASVPMLSFNASWRGTPSDILIASEASPGSPMVFLAWLRAPGPATERWEHYEVDLSALVGGSPRISITPVGGSYSALFISDLRVLDGGRTPRGDSFPTGVATEDGWEAYMFEPVVLGSYVKTSLPPLITGGDVRIERSAILVPGDIPRWSARTTGERTTDLELERDRAWLERSCGLDIALGHRGPRTSQDSLSIYGSTLENVPVGARNIPVHIYNSTFAGGTDLLTTYLCEGAVEGCRFDVDAPPEGADGRDDAGAARDLDWAVACQQTPPSASMVIRDDRFHGPEVGLLLNDARVEVSGCAFDSVTGICIWAHQTTGVDGWGPVGASNTFARCTGALFLGSRDCAVTFTMPGRTPQDGNDGYGHLAGGSALLLPSMTYVFADSRGGLLYLPTELVDGDGTVHAVDNVTVSLFSGWTGSKTFVVPAGSTTFVADFTAEEEGPKDEDLYMRFYTPVESFVTRGAGAGDAVIRIKIDLTAVRMFYEATSLLLRLRVDGALVQEWDLTDPEGLYPSLRQLVGNLTLPGGASLVNASMEGNLTDGRMGFPIFNDTFAVMRATDATTQADVSAFTSQGGHVLLLDPGVAMTADGLAIVPAFDWSAFEYVPTRTLVADLGEGSHLTVAGRGVGQGETVDLTVMGNGTLAASGLDCGVLRACTYGPRMILEDVDCLELYLTTGSFPGNTTGSIEGARVHVREWFCLWDLQGGNLTLEDSDLMLPQGTKLVNPGGSAAYANSTIRSDRPNTFEVMIDHSNYKRPERVNLEGCHLVNVTLLVDPSDLGHGEMPGVAVEGCTFEGDAAFLVLLDPDPAADGRPRPPWLTLADNAFHGPGTGLIATQGMIAPALDASTLDGGARAWGAYPFRIEFEDAGGEAQALPPFSWGSPARVRMDGLLPLMDTHLLRDVTGDPGAALSPGKADLVIREGFDGSVVGFATVDAMSGQLVVRSNRWGEVGFVLRDLLYGILDGTVFWTR